MIIPLNVSHFYCGILLLVCMAAYVTRDRRALGSVSMYSRCPDWIGVGWSFLLVRVDFPRCFGVA